MNIGRIPKKHTEAAFVAASVDPKPKREPTRQIAIRVPEWLIECAGNAAMQEGISRAAYMVQAVAQRLDKEGRLL